MEISKELQSHINNIRFYANKIEELAKKQLEKDISIGQATGINTGSGSLRFDCLGAIGAATHWINIYCDNITSNLKTADAQDKKLYIPEIEEEDLPF